MNNRTFLTERGNHFNSYNLDNCFVWNTIFSFRSKIDLLLWTWSTTPTILEGIVPCPFKKIVLRCSNSERFGRPSLSGANNPSMTIFRLKIPSILRGPSEAEIDKIKI